MVLRDECRHARDIDRLRVRLVLSMELLSLKLFFKVGVSEGA